MTQTSHSADFLDKIATVAKQLDHDSMEKLAAGLAQIRENEGRLFILGVGGSAANASHAVNDLRKLCEIETYAPTDNVAELTARTNDEGFETIFEGYLRTSRLRAGDGLLILSVGGGDKEANVSIGLIRAIDLARERGAAVYGIVGREQGYTARNADIAIVIPTPDDQLITPISEAYQAVVWHGLVSHPQLQTTATKW